MNTRWLTRIEYILALALTTTGCVFLAQGIGASSTAKAAGTNQAYTSTWTATQLVAVQAVGFTSTPVSIGVAGWDVKGSLGAAGFKETWATSGGSALAVTIDTANGTKKVTSSTSFTAADWNYGVAGRGAFKFSVLAPTAFGNSSGHTDNFANGNGAVQCIGSDNDCIYASGMYGFTQAEAMNQGRSSSQLDRGGFFMPLKWNITGTYCDDKTDAACN